MEGYHQDGLKPMITVLSSSPGIKLKGDECSGTLNCVGVSPSTEWWRSKRTWGIFFKSLIIKVKMLLNTRYCGGWASPCYQELHALGCKSIPQGQWSGVLKRSLVFDDAMERVHPSNSILINDKYQDDANSLTVLLRLLMLNTHFLKFSICFIFKLLKVQHQAVMLKRPLPLALDGQFKTITVQEMFSPMPVFFRL